MNVLPLSVLYARLCVWFSPAVVYIATTVFSPNPAVLLWSTTAEPENIVPQASGWIGVPSYFQCIRSVDVECPQVMFSHCDP